MARKSVTLFWVTAAERVAPLHMVGRSLPNLGNHLHECSASRPRSASILKTQLVSSCNRNF